MRATAGAGTTARTVVARSATVRSPALRRALLLVVGLALGCGEASPATTDRATVRRVMQPTVEAAGGPAPVVLCADTARSLVRWKGTEAVGSGHAGVVRVAGGRLRLRDGSVVGGDVTVDMRTIAVTDIPAHEVEARRQLREHLAHDEFFGTDRFPTARLVLTEVAGGEHGLYTVSGNLAIRDSVHNVTFEATAPVVTPDAVWATADFAIDRYRWGIEFDGRTSALRNALVDALIQLELTLVATGAACGPAGTASG